MTDKIDLHTHSTASDGTLTPSELVKAAYEAGLSAVALTDHDTTDGLSEFHAACAEYGIEGISGVEISARYHKQMHILGLFVDENNAFLAEKLGVLKNAREIRNRAVLELLQRNGMDITERDIISAGEDMRSKGRAHIARAMVNKGCVSSIDEAFAKYLKKGKSCYAERVTYSPEESIKMIKSAGGTAILAHPVYITEDYGELYALLSELKEYGLDGAECMYNSYTREFSEMCREICKKTGLVESGGSDFHGANKPGISPGAVSAGHVPYRTLLNIKLQRGSRTP